MSPRKPAAAGQTASAGQLAQLLDFSAAVRKEVAKAVVGLDETIDLLLAALLTRGHCLLIGVPGLAKTLLVESLAAVVNAAFNRVQFTPDLMPSDITGSEILDFEGRKREFRFVRGPVFCNILLADEINRTPPKTQAALLQSMQEHQVTVSGKTWPLPDPFFVLATQNPIEQEGTYPLPEAQLDRFMFCLTMGYPTLEQELDIIADRDRLLPENLAKVISGKTLLSLQQFLRNDYPVADNIKEAAVRIIRQSRPESSTLATVKKHVSWGAGPRAGVFFLHAAKAIAALQGKPAPDLDDLRKAALPVLRHRIILNYAGEAEGLEPDTLAAAILETV